MDRFLKFLALAALLAPAVSAAPPNIIVILYDDLGARELGSYGNTFNETPHMDRLAAEGSLFTHAYSPAPVCSPTRASLLTGQNPARHGITDFLEAQDDAFLDASKVTSVARTLKSAGYRTGIIGKWHLTRNYAGTEGNPPSHGFDEAILNEKAYIGGGDYRFPYAHIPAATQRIFPQEDLTRRLNLEALDFIDRNKEGPFFLFLSHYTVHTQLDAPDSLTAYFKAKREALGPDTSKANNPTLAAMLKLGDDGVGALVAKLKALGLDSNTLVIVTSDNGGDPPVTLNGELRNGKGNLWEGGLRVSFLARWPGQVPAGRKADAPISLTDLHPTFAALAGATLPQQALDGVSLAPLLRGSGAPASRSQLWHYPQVAPGGWARQSSSALQDASRRKLIWFHNTDRLELYDLAEDGSERRDLAAERPLQARMLEGELLGTLERMLRGYVFADDFEDKDASGWTTFGGSWSAATGAYKVGAGEGFRAVTDDRFFLNVDFQADVTPAAAGNAGLLVRSTAHGNGRFGYRGYYAYLNAATGEVALDRVGNNTATNLGKAAYPVRAGSPHRLKVTARGSQLKVFVNDTAKALLAVSDTLYRGGLVGFRAHQGAAAFDNLVARGLAPDSSVVNVRLPPGAAPASYRGVRRGSWLFPAASQGGRLHDLRGQRIEPEDPSAAAGAP